MSIKSDQATIFDQSLVLSAISSKKDGNLSYSKETYQIVNTYRRRWLSSLDIEPEDIVCMDVCNPDSWDTIRSVTITDKGSGALDKESSITADALMTNQKGVTLMLLVADCIPVIIHDPNKGVVALIHLGWRSTVQQLATKTIKSICDKYLSDPSDMKIYVGPSIRTPSYSFKSPIEQQSQPDWKPYLKEADNNRISVNLVGYNCRKFIYAGVNPDNIQICPVNTAKSQNYFSHYRASKQKKSHQEGRFAVLCMLR
jgi:copper oxidase (laccase) domain-containing protein